MDKIDGKIRLHSTFIIQFYVQHDSVMHINIHISYVCMYVFGEAHYIPMIMRYLFGKICLFWPLYTPTNFTRQNPITFPFYKTSICSIVV